jgi:uncharacterized protein YfbU (UPF0304 family)
MKGEQVKPETLTAFERLQLINQLRILEKLDPNNAEDYAESRDIIAHGYTIQYEDVFNEVFEEIDVEECKYVYDVLDMYRVLIHSYNALTEKKGLTPEDVRFQGFDGNNESKRHAFAEHLRKQGKWTETLTGGLNSHSMMTMSLYPRMLARFEPIRTQIIASHGDWLLAAEQIREVIS